MIGSCFLALGAMGFGMSLARDPRSVVLLIATNNRGVLCLFGGKETRTLDSDGKALLGQALRKAIEVLTESIAVESDEFAGMDKIWEVQPTANEKITPLAGRLWRFFRQLVWAWNTPDALDATKSGHQFDRRRAHHRKED